MLGERKCSFLYDFNVQNNPQRAFVTRPLNWFHKRQITDEEAESNGPSLILTEFVPVIVSTVICFVKPILIKTIMQLSSVAPLFPFRLKTSE